MPPIRMRVTNISNGAVLARRVWLALTFWDRISGLHRLPRLSDGDAFVLRPCHRAHTMGLGYPIVAVYLDDEGRVVAAPMLVPNRIGPYVRSAYLVIELPVSRADRVNPGDLLEIGVEGRGPTGSSKRRPRRVRRLR